MAIELINTYLGGRVAHSPEDPNHETVILPMKLGMTLRLTPNLHAIAESR